MTLQDVQWQTDNTYNANDYEIGDRFTAICTYGGTKTVSYVTGYTTTADYTGEVYRTGVSVIRYTVVYTGSPVVPAEPEKAEGLFSETNWLLVVIPALITLGAGIGGTYLWNKRKERAFYEKITDAGRSDSDLDRSNSDAGPGPGIPD